MATDAVRRRRAKTPAANQARARRERVALVAGVLLLVGLLAFEGPKTLKGLRAASSNPVTASPATTAAPASPQPAATAAPSTSLKALSGFKAKDPFVAQLGSGATSTVATPAASPPRVRTSHFVQKDPFVQQLGAPTEVAPAPTPAVPPKVLQPKRTPTTKATTARKQPQSLASLGSGTVVIVASIPMTRGQAAAEQAAAQASARGVRDVRVAVSSTVYAVYAGPYPTSAAVSKELDLVRRAGYTTAYTRRLGS